MDLIAGFYSSLDTTADILHFLNSLHFVEQSKMQIIRNELAKQSAIIEHEALCLACRQFQLFSDSIQCQLQLEALADDLAVSRLGQSK